VLGEPKTRKSRRTVRLTQRAMVALINHRKRQLEEKSSGRPLRGLRARIRLRERRPHQSLEPTSAVVSAPTFARGSPLYHLPRPTPHLRLAALPEERPPQVRAGASRTRFRRHHPRRLLPESSFYEVG
jgi:hypothetical protein